MKTDVSHKEFQICNNNFTTDINEPRKQLEKVKCQKQNIGKKKKQPKTKFIEVASMQFNKVSKNGTN